MVQFYREWRECVGLLLSQGHTAARKYPYAFMLNETRFTRNRLNDIIATNVVGMQTVAAFAFGHGEALKEFLKRLNDG